MSDIWQKSSMSSDHPLFLSKNPKKCHVLSSISSVHPLSHPKNPRYTPLLSSKSLVHPLLFYSKIFTFSYKNQLDMIFKISCEYLIYLLYDIITLKITDLMNFWWFFFYFSIYIQFLCNLWGYNFSPPKNVILVDWGYLRDVYLPYRFT